MALESEPKKKSVCIGCISFEVGYPRTFSWRACVLGSGIVLSMSNFLVPRFFFVNLCLFRTLNSVSSVFGRLLSTSPFNRFRLVTVNRLGVECDLVHGGRK